MFGISIGLAGYMLKKVSVPWRLIAIAGGLGLIDPGVISDIVGFLLIAAMATVQIMEWKKDKKAITA